MIENFKTLIVAEAGVNHNGDIKLAKQLIDVAAEAGADLVKFQTFRAKNLVTQTARKAPYQDLSDDPSRSQFDMLRQLELSPDMHAVLIEHCIARKIDFISTGFDVDSLNFLYSLKIPYFKVPSGEITNLPYLRHLGSFGASVLLSTGMATLGEIEAALNVLEEAGTPRNKITILHCNTEYPTPIQDVNLRAMCSIREAFGVAVGYSDHSMGIEVSIAAVALGATVIEKHLTLDRNLRGPDQKTSLEAKEFSDMVKSIRNIERAIGDGIKRPSSSENKNKEAIRKSLVAAKAIRVGEIFTPDNIAVKRPGTGISPMRWDEVIGRVATQDFSTDELIVL